MADFSLNVKINGVDQAVNTVSQIEQALIATRNELKNVAIGSDAFEKLSTQAQTLQREFVNSYKETTNFNKGIAELGQSVGALASTVTAGFSIATSAFALFGAEGEEVSEAQVKAQQALALALGASTIATNAKTLAEDLSNVAAALGLNLTLANTEATAVNTAATVASTVALEGEAVASTGAAVATRSFSAALAANPIGLILVGLTALIGALVIFSGESETAASNADELNSSIREQNGLIKKQNDDLIGLYKARREAQIATITDEKKRTEELRKLNDEVNGFQEESAKKNVERQVSSNDELLKNFTKYKNEFTSTREEIREVAQFDEFGVNIGSAQESVTVKYKLGQQELQNLTDRKNAELKLVDSKTKQIVDAETGKITKITLTEEEKALERQQILTRYYLDYLNKQQEFFKKSEQADDEQYGKNLADFTTALKAQRTALEQSLAEQLRIKAEADKKEAEEEAKRVAEQKAEAERRAKELKKAREDARKNAEDGKKELIAIEQSKADEIARIEFEAALKSERNPKNAQKLIEDRAKVELDAEKKKINEVLAEEIKAVEGSKLIGKEKKKIEEGLRKEAADAEAEAAKLSKLNTEATVKEEVRLREDQAVLLKTINDTLNREIAFGDNNTADRKEALAEREKLITIDQLQIQIDNNNLTLDSFEKLQEQKLALQLSYNESAKRLELQELEDKTTQEIAIFEDYLKKTFGEEFDTTELVNKFKANKALETAVVIQEIEQKYTKQNGDIQKKSIDDVNAYRIKELTKLVGALKSSFDELRGPATQGWIDTIDTLSTATEQFLNLSKTKFDTAAQAVGAYAQAIGSTISGLLQAASQANQAQLQQDLDNLQIATNTQKDIQTTAYNEEIAALQEKFNQGLITEQQYRDAQSAITDTYNKNQDKADRAAKAQELKLKKEAFEQDKKFRIAQAVIAGLQGAVTAFTGAMTLGPIAGPIVGGILAGAVAALTAVQVAAISKQQFNAGGTTVAPIDTNVSAGANSAVGGQDTMNNASAGGFTGFNQNLLGSPGGAGATGTALNPQPPQRVYVLESDITDSQRRVSTLESNATFG